MQNNALKMDIVTRLIVWLLRIIKFFRRQPVPVEKMRANLEKRQSKIKHKFPDGIALQEKTVAGIPCSYLDNSKATEGNIILHLHGGAMCLRTLETEIGPIAEYAGRFSANVLFPRYRLSPENKFPAGLDDCFAVYKQLLDDGYDPKKILLSGLSAGGGYSLAVLSLIKQQQLPMPACVVLLSPSGDGLFVGKSFYENNLKDPVFYGSDIGYYQNLLVAPEQVADPLLNVSLMDEFSGYPPLYLSASENEVLRDVCTTAAEKAKLANTVYQLDIFPGGFHGTQLLSTSQAKAIWVRIDQFTAEHYPSSNG